MSRVFDQIEERLMEIERAIVELYENEQMYNDGDQPEDDSNAITSEAQNLLREASDLEIEWLDNYIREYDGNKAGVSERAMEVLKRRIGMRRRAMLPAPIQVFKDELFPSEEPRKRKNSKVSGSGTNSKSTTKERKRVTASEKAKVKLELTEPMEQEIKTEQDGDEEVYYCPVCGIAYVEGVVMMGCDHCDQWFHYYGCTDLTEIPPEDEPWYCRLCTEVMKNEVSAINESEALEQAIKTVFETEVTPSEVTEEMDEADEANHMPNSDDQLEADESTSVDQLEAQDVMVTSDPDLITEMEDMELKMDENNPDLIDLEEDEVVGAAEVEEHYASESTQKSMDGAYAENADADNGE